MIVKLLVVSSLNEGTTIEIVPNSCTSFGRNDRADWFGDDSRMSGLHFEVENIGDRAVVRDRCSIRGTRLNKSFITDETELAESDEISAGQTTCRVQFLSEGDPK